MPTTKQIACIRTLIIKTGNIGNKETIISGFTNGRTTSIKALEPDETTAVIKHLRGMQTDNSKETKMKNKILSLAHEMHWHLPGTRKVDMKRVDGWMKQTSYLKKPLDSYTYKELPKLVSQFENVYKYYLNNL